MSTRANSAKPSIVLRILVVVFCAYLIYSLGSYLVELNAKKAELATLEQQAAQTQARVTELDKLLTEGSIEEIVEKAARERLGYIFSDEQVFIDVSGN